ncbi:metacaspase type I [Haematococcus lacustris]
MWPPPGQPAYPPPTVYQQPGYPPQYPAPYGAPAPYGGAPPAPGYTATPPYGAQPAPGYGYLPAAGEYGQPPPAQAQYPPHPAAPPMAMPPPGGPQKKAVLVGCSYPGTRAQLNGCINDVKCMKHLLTTRFGFHDSNIILLRDDERHPDFYPSRANINRAMQWLMTGQQPGSSLFFHFSGHGSQRQDTSGDEEDFMDETILPSDHETAGQIVDDELNLLLVRPLLPGVNLHAVVDACHSGTVMDLAYRTKYKPGQGFTWKGRQVYGKGTAGGTCLQFGACRDNQVAQDTNRMSGSAYTGAATFSFIQAIERGGAQQTYAQVLAAMSQALTASQGPSSGINPQAIVGGVLGMLMGGGLPSLISSGQQPVLSCDKALDINYTRLML